MEILLRTGDVQRRQTGKPLWDKVSIQLCHRLLTNWEDGIPETPQRLWNRTSASHMTAIHSHGTGQFWSYKIRRKSEHFFLSAKVAAWTSKPVNIIWSIPASCMLQFHYHQQPQLTDVVINRSPFRTSAHAGGRHLHSSLQGQIFSS